MRIFREGVAAKWLGVEDGKDKYYISAGPRAGYGNLHREDGYTVLHQKEGDNSPSYEFPSVDDKELRQKIILAAWPAVEETR